MMGHQQDSKSGEATFEPKSQKVHCLMYFDNEKSARS